MVVFSLLSLAQGTMGEFHFHWKKELRKKLLFQGLKELLSEMCALLVLLLVFEGVTCSRWKKLFLKGSQIIMCEHSLIWKWKSFSSISLVNQEESTSTTRKRGYLLVLLQGPLLGKVWRLNNLSGPRAIGQNNYLHFTTWRNRICPWIFWCANIEEVSCRERHSAGQATRTIKTGIKWNFILAENEWFRHLYLGTPAYSTVFLKELMEHKSCTA